MSGHILFSVIIPAKDEATSIERCINSLLRQSVPPDSVEIIVVDNASSDETATLARSLGARVESMPEGSIAALRNRGAALAAGDIFAFVDADMELPAQFLEYFPAAREAHGCDALGLHVASGAGGIWAVWENRNLRSGVARTDFLASSNLIVTREAFARLGGFDEALWTGEDKDFTQRLTAQGGVCCISGELTAVHLGADDTFRRFVVKEFWRQGSALALARKNGWPWRLLRFPAASLLFLGALVVSLALLPTLPQVLPLTLVLSLALTAFMTVRKWGRRSFRETAIIAVLALVRFWAAGAATALALVGLPVQQVPGDPAAAIRQEGANLFVRLVLGLLLAVPAALIIGIVYIVVKGVFREPGPFFYVSERVGLHRKIFKLYKIRTLKENASQILGNELYTADRVLTIRGGDFLRRTRIDELPQIFNLIRGDMNIIGPRPMRPSRLNKFPQSDLRFCIKPGLTGVSQMITPHHTPERVRSILDTNIYLLHCSIGMQLKWVALTIFSVARKVLEEARLKIADFMRIFRKAMSEGNNRKMRRVKVQSDILVRDGERERSYRVHDMNYSSISFFVPEDEGKRLKPGQALQVTLIVNAKKTDRAARCDARLLFVSSGQRPDMHKVIVEYVPQSEYSRYLIDKYILKECLF